jgi:prepilin-type N-terminal cleavage/methylation domain-containing protein
MLRRKVFVRGFSLVELMVVIVIMTILAGMVFVGLSSAQTKAQTVQCLNNLRQIGNVIHTYATQKGGGRLPDFSVDSERRAREQWVWELDFITEDQHYEAIQDTTKVIPPRLAPAVLRCPGDVQLFVNSQSVLTSYWMHPENTYKPLSSIRMQNETMLAFEGDALYETANCGCRFHSAEPPWELDTTHAGGGHILFVSGSVRIYRTPELRKRETWEERAGWDPKQLKAKYGW